LWLVFALALYTFLECAVELVCAKLYSALCFITGQSHSATVWAGTNAGIVYIYQLTVPAADKREEDIVQCILGLYLVLFS